MPDPTTSNVLLAVPTRGSDSGTWDTPVNGDFTALDGMLGGNASIALSAATTLALTTPATGTVSASAGPNQSQNAVIKLTGTLTGAVVIQLTLPRTYIFDNQCTVGTTYVQIAPVTGTGTKVGLPPGQKTRINFDGTNVDYIGMPLVGTLHDMCVSGTPAWMQACSTSPFLLADGSTYSTSVYPALGAMLGSTFGGNGITTFGVPDCVSRLRIAVDPGGVKGRVTSPVSNVNGATVGAVGGSQEMQAHTHTPTVNDPSHSHNTPVSPAGGANAAAQGNASSIGLAQSNVATTGISVSIATTGGGSYQNMPPVIVFGLTFIKT